MAWHFNPRNGETALFAGAGDPLDLVLKFNQHVIMLLSCRFEWHSNRNLMFRILDSEQEIEAAFLFLKERFMPGPVRTARE